MNQKGLTLISDRAALLAVSSGAFASNEASIILIDVNGNFDLLALLESKHVVDAEVRQNIELGFVRKLFYCDLHH